MRVFGLAVVRRLLHAGLCDILPLRGAPYVHRGFYHCLVLRSCTCPLRINTAGSPGCLSQEQKGLDEGARMASQRPSHPCGRPRRRPCGRTSPAQAPSPCRFPPPCLLTPLLAGAMAARGTAAPHAASTHDRSVRLPLLGYRAATAWS